MDIRSTANPALTGTMPVQKNAAGVQIPVPDKPAAMAASPTATQAMPTPSPAQVAEAIKSINKVMQAQGLEFSFDAGSDRPVVKVIDHETREVLRQIPSEQALEIAKAMDAAQGMLLRQKA